MKAMVNCKLVFPDQIKEGVLLMDGGKILAAGDVAVPEGAEIIDAQGAYAGPGLLDIHCHGYAQAGETPVFFDTMTDPVSVAAHHLRHGTTSITPTVGYTFTQEVFLEAVRMIRQATDDPDSPIEGIHFEGPYINPKYGSNSHKCWTYDKEVAETIIAAAGPALRHVTYAPELPGADEWEKMIVAAGAVPALGHTEMDPESAERAVAAGARITTHLFDAMGSWRGTYWKGGVSQDAAPIVALAIPELYYELICDSRGIHVPPYCARMALRTAGEDKIILITDCVSRVSHNPADYPADSPMSAPDLNFNETGGLSGSRLVLSGACQNFIRYAGGDVRTAFKCAATNPAKALGLDAKIGTIYPGKDANVLLVDEKFNVQKVIFHGEEVV